MRALLSGGMPSSPQPFFTDLPTHTPYRVLPTHHSLSRPELPYYITDHRESSYKQSLLLKKNGAGQEEV